MPAHTARCAISKQSIAEGESCRVILISQAATFNPCHVSIHDKEHQLYGCANTDVGPTSNWTSFSPFLRAVYDDFGMSQLILETKIDRVKALNVFASLIYTGAKTAAGENGCHDYAFDFRAFVEQHAPSVTKLIPADTLWQRPVYTDEGVSVEEMQLCWTYASDLIRRHRVFVFKHLSQPRPLEACFVHEAAYQAMYQHTCSQVDWDKNSLAPAAYAKRSVLARVARAKDAYVEEMAGGKSTEEARSYALAVLSESSISDYRHNVDFSDPVLRHAYSRLAVQVYDEKLSVEAYVEVLAPLLSDIAVGRAMQAFDLKLEPVTYVRGDDENRVSHAYAKLVLQIAEVVSTQREALLQ